MTKEEAINVMQKYTDTDSGISKVVAQAHEMAIKALEQEPCEDCISRQAVLVGLASIAKAKAKSDKQQSLMGRCMFFVEQLPSVQPVSRWIPCSKREPEEYGEYMITWTTSCSMAGGKYGFIGSAECEITNEFDHDKGRFKVEWLLDDYIKNYPDVKVIAWMPLPEPFEPQESEVEE